MLTFFFFFFFSPHCSTHFCCWWWGWWQQQWWQCWPGHLVNQTTTQTHKCWKVLEIGFYSSKHLLLLIFLLPLFSFFRFCLLFVNKYCMSKRSVCVNKEAVCVNLTGLTKIKVMKREGKEKGAMWWWSWWWWEGGKLFTDGDEEKGWSTKYKLEKT